MLKKAILFVAAALLLMTDCAALSTANYALIEASTGRLIKGSNIDRRLPMASTTKIMTGLLACESGRLDELFTVAEEAIKVEGSSMGLLANEKITLRDLTYGLLLESGNDAANAIAYALAGSIPEFAKLMNRKAAELGLKNTSFANPSGLDAANHYTTPLDLARLGAFAMKNEEFAKIASTYAETVTYNGIKNGRALRNHNELLKMYSGCIGIKTGYTMRSGRCLVSCAERGGVTIVAATLNGHENWDDHKTLLDYGFQKLKFRPLFSSFPEFSLDVFGGDLPRIKCGYDRDLTALLTEEELSRVKMRTYFPKFAYAPIAEGQRMGKIVFELDGNILAETEILSRESVAQEKPNRLKDFWMSIFG